MLELSIVADVLEINGVVDFSTARDCCSQGLVLLKQYQGDSIRIDLSKIDASDSSIISCLVLWHNAAVPLGLQLKYSGCSENMRQLIVLCGLDYLL